MAKSSQARAIRSAGRRGHFPTRRRNRPSPAGPGAGAGAPSPPPRWFPRAGPALRLATPSRRARARKKVMGSRASSGGSADSAAPRSAGGERDSRPRANASTTRAGVGSPTATAISLPVDADRVCGEVPDEPGDAAERGVRPLHARPAHQALHEELLDHRVISWSFRHVQRAVVEACCERARRVRRRSTPVVAAKASRRCA